MSTMTKTGTRGAGGRTEPTNKSDRARFASLTESVQAKVVERSAALYDGTHTVAACWKIALDEAGAL